MANVRSRSVPAQLEAEAYAVKQLIKRISMSLASKERKSYSITSREEEKDEALLDDSEFGRG